MDNIRVIPCLLIDDQNLIKTKKFTDPVYVGDALNAVRIFNEKEVDELVVLDRSARLCARPPDFDFIGQLASECFMPLAYGGGITTLEHVGKLLQIGVEKVIFNSALISDPTLIQEAVATYGSQAISASIDVRRKMFGRYEVITNAGRNRSGKDPISFGKYAEQLGVGEIFLTSIDLEGTMEGYDLNLIYQVSNNVNVPVIASGGAGKLSDFKAAIEFGNASAVAASSMFVFHGRHRAVLINYPGYNALQTLFGSDVTP